MQCMGELSLSGHVHLLRYIQLGNSGLKVMYLWVIGAGVAGLSKNAALLRRLLSQYQKMANYCGRL